MTTLKIQVKDPRPGIKILFQYKEYLHLGQQKMVYSYLCATAQNLSFWLQRSPTFTIKRKPVSSQTA